MKNMYFEYKFNKILILSKHTETENNFIKFKINYDILGFYIDINKFKMRENIKKEYDVLCYGSRNSNVYPLRYKICKVLKKIKENTNYNIKIIDMKSYDNRVSNVPTDEELSILLNKSKYAIATSSRFDLLLKKYVEIPLSNCKIIGNYPSDYKHLYHNNIEHLNISMSEDEIYRKIINILENNYNSNSTDFVNSLSNLFCFNKGYENICSLI